MSGPTSPSFPDLYQDHFEYAWACLRRLGVPPEAQEDALQDLFLVIHRRLPEFAGRSSLKTWIFGVARRVAARHRRTEARRLRRHARLAAVTAAEPLAVDEDEVVRREARRRLAEFLDGLDDDRRAVFVLHLYEEMSAPEIAQTLGVNINTVYSRIRLVREQFDRTFAGAAPGALRVAKAPEAPPHGAQARVWAALLLVVGSGATAAAPGAALAHGAATAGHQALAWSLGLVAAAGIVVVAAAPPASEPPSQPRAESISAPIAGTASTATREAAVEPIAAATPPAVTVEPSARRRGGASGTTGDRLAAEAELIAEVRAAIDAGRIDDALAGLRRHQREFPDGVLQRERLGLRAIALCRADRAGEGRSEAAAFLRDHPDSALAARVRQGCDLPAEANPPVEKNSPAP
ncbi:RNA polymerase sigma factor [Nannocystis radixulma]|uniref:Sigma-70 family RNA polymerase sigma factor n=1 Tax=Nannocystis radixulma TaxID=2995305 RepID=A0ABT5BHQ8_9BACT|nr:sigma-70 family RNA polymerase sigma factor [Nannocystis radixulma]MDC0672577.1 sigma-70 family RNA polymerase sigma factor [Nannocystis radixulma]